MCRSESNFGGLFPRHCMLVCQNYLILHLTLLFQFLRRAHSVCLSYVAGASSLLQGIALASLPICGQP